MGIKITSDEGGVGKSTLALMLAKLLALKSKKVALFDMDLLGYPSWILGIKDDGILNKLKRKENYSRAIKEIKIGNGLIIGIKLFDGYTTIENLDENLISYIKNIINSVINKTDYTIIDTPITPIREKIKILEPKGKCLKVIRYNREISENSKDRLFIINMAPSIKYKDSKYKDRIVLPFNEKLFNYNGDIYELPILENLTRLLNCLD